MEQESKEAQMRNAAAGAGGESGAFDCLPGGVFVLHRQNGKIHCTAVNAAGARMLGEPAQALRGQTLVQLSRRVHPDDWRRLGEDLKQMLGGKRCLSGSYRLRDRAAGGYSWRRMEGSVQRGAGGSEDLYFVCTDAGGEDVRRESRSAMESFANMVPGGVFVYAADGEDRFTFVSNNFLAMLGYSRAEFDRMCNGRFSYMIYPPDRERVLAEIENQIANGPTDTCFYRIERRDGRLIWVHDEGRLVTDEDGTRWFYVVTVDITASVNSRDTLAQQNRELRQIIDNVPVSVFVFRKTAGEIRAAAVNGFLCRLLNTTPDALMALSDTQLLELVHPDDRTAVGAFLRRMFREEQTSGELTYRTAPGTGQKERWVHCSAVQVQQREGSSLVYAVYTNATYQKQREQDFNRILQELLTANPNSLCTFRLNLTRNLCSDGHGASLYTRQLIDARTADELLERISSIIAEPAEAQDFRRQYSRERLLASFRTGADRLSTTYHRMTENGEPHWVTTYFHILQNPFTDDVEAVAYSLDADHTRKEEEIVAAITGEEYDYIGLAEAQTGRLTFYHTARGGLLPGLSLPEFYADGLQLVSAQIPRQEDRAQYLQKVSLDTVKEHLRKEPLYTLVYTRSGADGTHRRKQVTFRYLEGSRREIMFACADITAAFQREEAYTQQLQQALRDAEKANEMKSAFLGNVSHDMRTPLNAILGYAGLALQDGEAAGKDDCLRKIQVAGHTLLSLVNDTLDLQKIENGAAELHLEPVPCSEIIRDVVNAVQPLMEKKHLTFTLDNERAVMATINTDPMRLRQVFINLLSNAAKYTPAGGHVTLAVECVRLEPRRVYDRLTVRDDGVGMSEAFQEKMFEPFSQERTAATAGIGGSGLGLSIVRRVVEQMGGRLEVRSTLGRGTEITVYLDFERADTAPASGLTAAPAASIRGVRILLCEDNAMNTEIARRLLEAEGAAVTTAADGAEGAARFTASAPGTFDLILMDIRMPNMDGYAAARVIRASHHAQARTIPILAMSADAYASDVQKSLAAGMNGHLAKPIDPQKMTAEIARQLQLLQATQK